MKSISLFPQKIEVPEKLSKDTQPQEERSALLGSLDSLVVPEGRTLQGSLGGGFGLISSLLTPIILSLLLSQHPLLRLQQQMVQTRLFGQTPYRTEQAPVFSVARRGVPASTQGPRLNSLGHSGYLDLLDRFPGIQRRGLVSDGLSPAFPVSRLTAQAKTTLRHPLTSIVQRDNARSFGDDLGFRRYMRSLTPSSPKTNFGSNEKGSTDNELQNYLKLILQKIEVDSDVLKQLSGNEESISDILLPTFLLSMLRNPNAVSVNSGRDEATNIQPDLPKWASKWWSLALLESSSTHPLTLFLREFFFLESFYYPSSDFKVFNV